MSASINQQTLSVMDFGAVADGTANSRTALQAAIDACAVAGGGKVTIPAGVFLTGSLELKSNVELHLEQNAKLLFTDNPEDYLPAAVVAFEGIEAINYRAPLYAYRAENIAVTGAGTLEARIGKWFAFLRHNESTLRLRDRLYNHCRAQDPLSERDMVAERMKFEPQGCIRPNMVHFNRCRNIRLEGVNFRNSPCWQVHFFLCDGVRVENCDIRGRAGNNDGIDIEATKNVVVRNCRLECGDDAFVFKAGRDADGRRLATPTENVLCEDCHIVCGHNVVACGSELSGGLRNITVRNCTADDIATVIHLKTSSDRGGFVENVHVTGIRVRRLQQCAVMLTTSYFVSGDRKTRERVYHTPMKDILIENIIAGYAPTVEKLSPDPECPPENLVIRNVTIDRKEPLSIYRAAQYAFDFNEEAGITPALAKLARGGEFRVSYVGGEKRNTGWHRMVNAYLAKRGPQATIKETDCNPDLVFLDLAADWDGYSYDAAASAMEDILRGFFAANPQVGIINVFSPTDYNLSWYRGFEKPEAATAIERLSWMYTTPTVDLGGRALEFPDEDPDERAYVLITQLLQMIDPVSKKKPQRIEQPLRLCEKWEETRHTAPAANEAEAFVLGNGGWSARCFGGTSEERVELLGGPFAKPAEIKIAFSGHEAVTQYRRCLAENEGIATVDYQIDGVCYKREMFVSAADGVLVMRFAANERQTLQYALQGVENFGLGKNVTVREFRDPYGVTVVVAAGDGAVPEYDYFDLRRRHINCHRARRAASPTA